MSKSNTWKASEKQWASTLRTFNVEASRILDRNSNFAISTFDVSIKDEEWIKSDSKYKKNGFLTTGLLKEVSLKYCKSKKDTAILITKDGKQHGQTAVIEANFLAALLSVFLGRLSRDEAMEIYLNEK